MKTLIITICLIAFISTLFIATLWWLVRDYWDKDDKLNID